MNPYASYDARAEAEAIREAAGEQIGHDAETFWRACLTAYAAGAISAAELDAVSDAIGGWCKAELPAVARREIDGAGERMRTSLACMNAALGRRTS